jgi:NADH:ubiquinone oxidoreductase subunit 5 (subunit L)/multisubunit Na+/H+ antiporter MnhA subunit
MPWVAWLALIGTLAIAGLPPLNGFVSEWLLLQSFLFTPQIPQAFANMLIPLGAALLALVAALAGYVMVKFYGVIFLGQMREPQLAQARDCGRLERLGLLWFATGCVVLGVIPSPMLDALDPVLVQLTGTPVVQPAAAPWWLLAPVSAQRAAYGPLVFLLGVVVVVLLTFVVVRRFYHGRLHRSAPWGCGYPQMTPRMQDTAEGFGYPIRHIFEPFFRMQRHLPSAFDPAPHYQVVVEDRFWATLYRPLVSAVQNIATQVGRLQQGRIAVYLLYSFLTLIGLLVIVL